MSKVTKMYPKNAADNPDNVLEQAVGEYSAVMLLGYDKQKKLELRTSTNMNRKEMLWIMERVKAIIISLGEEND